MRKWFLVILLASPVATWGQTFTSSNLPIIVINTNGQEIVDDPKIEATMGIIYNGPGVRNNVTDAFNNFDGKIGIEIRGSSSQSFPKKQYGVELMDDEGEGLEASLLGLPKQEDWVLFAPYNDKSLMRDALAYKMGRALGSYAPRTKYCEVVLNGEYQGIYVLIEKIKRDKNRVDINKLDPDEIAGDNLTGGYIIKIDKESGSDNDGWTSAFVPRPRVGGQRINYLYEYPKASNIASEQKQYIQQYMSNFETALNGSNFRDPVQGYAKYIDVNSFVDFFIMQEVTKNPDGYRISTFMHKKKDSDGGKLYMGPIWDFNLGFGNVNYCTNGNTDGFVADYNRVCPEDYWLIPFWWDRLLQDEEFGRKVAERWTSLRSNQFQTAKIHAYIDSVAGVLNVESQQRNFQRWPVLGQYVWPNYFVGNTFQSEVTWLKNWVTVRMQWLDFNMDQLITGVEEGPSDLFSAAVYPNPVTSELTISYKLPAAGLIEFKLMDATGREIRSFANESEAGEHLRYLDSGNLPSGIYFYMIKSGSGGLITGKLVK